jgi:L-asparaginase
VSLGAYEAGSALLAAGAVSGHNMTTEAAVTKLTWLISRGLSPEEIHRLMETDLRGELTE